MMSLVRTERIGYWFYFHGSGRDVLGQLQPEIRRHIAGFLDPFALAALASVSTSWQRICRHPSLWDLSKFWLDMQQRYLPDQWIHYNGKCSRAPFPPRSSSLRAGEPQTHTHTCTHKEM